MPTSDHDADVVLAWKRERRAVIRRLHPDRGGSADDLMRALADVDERFGFGATTYPRDAAEPEVSVTHSRTYLIRLGARRLQLLIELAREHLPRRWPGARRTTRL